MGKESRRPRKEPRCPYKEPRCPRAQLELKVDNAAKSVNNYFKANVAAGWFFGGFVASINHNQNLNLEQAKESYHDNIRSIANLQTTPAEVKVFVLDLYQWAKNRRRLLSAPAATHITITNNVTGSNNIVYLASIMNIIDMQGNNLQALKLPSPPTPTTVTIINNVSGSDNIVYSASVMNITYMQESAFQALKLPSPLTPTATTIINNVSGSDNIVYSASVMNITDMQESDLQALKAQVTLKK